MHLGLVVVALGGAFCFAIGTALVWPFTNHRARPSRPGLRVLGWLIGWELAFILPATYFHHFP